MTKEVENRSKRIFYIPLEERFLHLVNPGTQVTCMHVGNVGLFIYHDGTRELNPEFIRYYSRARKTTDCLIEAYSAEEAIKIFYNQWEAANIGGEARMEKALWINTKVPIIGLPLSSCELLGKNKEGRYICGKEVGFHGSGEFGMCILDQSSLREDECPISKFYDTYSERRGAETLPIKTVNIDGVDYPYVLAEDLLPT